MPSATLFVAIREDMTDLAVYLNQLKAQILAEETFIWAACRGAQRGQTPPWQRVELRPVLIKGRRHLQFSYFDGRQTITKNYRGAAAEEKVSELLALPFNSVVVHNANSRLRLQISRKGRPILHQDKPPATPAEPDLVHDRPKNLLLPDGRPDPFLQTIGITTKAGRVKSDMRAKFRQVNQFLELVSQTIEGEELPPSLHLVDCGCGGAYLTFAAYHYFNHLLGRPTSMTGIDLKAGLLARRAAEAADLGWTDLTFQASSIIDFKPARQPDVVLALHACDTATDEALAQGIGWGSRFIFSAPCCHHHLQNQLDERPPFRPLFRHGILKERLGDILTDTFRALILRLMGYRTDVVEFVAAEHTDKNLLIRAVQTTPPGDPQFVREYQALKTFWGVTPYLEELLGERLRTLINGKSYESL